MGITKISLKILDGENGKYTDLFSCTALFFKYLGASILYGLIIFAGSLLFIIPGIIWAIRYQFCIYFVIDKGLRPIEALKMSSKIIKGNKRKLFYLN